MQGVDHAARDFSALLDSLGIEMFVLWTSWKCLKFIYKRFIKQPRPPGKIIKKSED